MSPLNWTASNQGAYEMPDLLKNRFTDSSLSRWCSYAALSLSCLAGCQTAREVTDSTAAPWRAPVDLMASAGARVGESLESAVEPFSRRSTPSDCPTEQSLANKVPTYPKSLARPSGQPNSATQIARQNGVPTSQTNALANNNVEFLAAPPVTQAAGKNAHPVVGNAPASHNESQPANSGNSKSMRPDSAPAPIAPPEPLPAQAVSQSREVTPISAVVNTPNAAVANPAVTNAAGTQTTAQNATWCRVRVRNVGTQPATQVGVSITSPANAQAKLLTSDSGTTSPAVDGRMDFAPIAQVAPNEEIIVMVGVVAADERSNRLRVQVRDAQGGTNQDVQSRWKVTIEAAEQP